jgi:hypothetical protein
MDKPAVTPVKSPLVTATGLDQIYHMGSGGELLVLRDINLSL